MHYNAMRPNLSNPNLKKGQNPKCAGLEELKFSIKVDFNPTCEEGKIQHRPQPNKTQAPS